MRHYSLRLTVLLLCCCAFQFDLNAQFIPPNCSGSLDMPGFCDQSCVVCDMDGYVNSSSPLQGLGDMPPGYCTFIAHHIQYVAFVAGTEDISFDVVMGPCVSGNSLEMGVYESFDCTTYDLVSNCNTAMFQNTTYSFNNTVPLCVGQHYYFVFDGNGPAECEFTVNVTSGSMAAPTATVDGPIEGPEVVCAGEPYSYEVPVTAYKYFDWTIVGGEVQTDENSATVDIIFDSAGPAQVCVTADGACNEPTEVCLDIEVVLNEPGEEGPFIICSNNFYNYDGNDYSPGEYDVELETDSGCDSIIHLIVEGVEVSEMDLQEGLCYPACYDLGGESYCESGEYSYTFQSSEAPFCDSVVNLNLEVLGADVQLEVDGMISCSTSDVFIYSFATEIYGSGNITYTWTNADGDVVGNMMDLEVDEPGFYTLTVTITGNNNFSCSNDATIEVLGSLDGPDISVDDLPFVCRGGSYNLDSVFVIDQNNTGGTITFHDDTPADASNQINSIVNPDENTVYYVLSTDGGCTDETSFTLAVVDNPDLEIFGTYDVCGGDSLDLSTINVVDNNNLNGNITYHTGTPADASNQLNNLMVAPTVPTTYYILSSLGNCNGEIPVTIGISQNPDLTVQGSYSICSGDSLLKSDIVIVDNNGLGGTITFHSSLPATAANEIPGAYLSPTVTTTYFIVSSLGNCIGTASVIISVESTPVAEFTVTPEVCVNIPAALTYTGNVTSSTNFTWSVDGGTYNGNFTSTMFVRWDSPGPKEIILQVDINGCESEPDTMYLEVVESLPPPVVNCETDENSILFYWDTIPGATDYIITVLNGGPVPTSTSDTSAYFNNLSTGQEVVIEIEVLGDGPCPDPVLSVTCEASDCPDITLTIDPVDTICLTSLTPNEFLDVDYIGTDSMGNGTWSGPGIIDGDIGIFDPSAANIGNNQIVFTYDEGTCRYNVSTNIFIRPQPVASFTATNPVCADSSVLIQFDGVALASADYNWSFGPATILSGSGVGPYEVVFPNSGEYSISLSIDEDNCISNPFQQLISVEQPVTLSLDCEQFSNSIEFFWTAMPDASNYNVIVVSGPTGMMLSDTSYLVDGLGAGQEVIIQVEALGSSVCTNPVATLACEATACPDIQLSITPVSPICLDPGISSIAVQGDFTGGQGIGSISWSGNGITDSNAGIFDPAIAGPGTHTITFAYTENDCDYDLTTDIVVHPVPNADAGIDDILDCSYNSVMLDGMNSSQGGEYTYSWSGPVTSSSTLQTLTDQPGIYTLTVTNTITGCTSEDEVEILFNPGTLLGLSASAQDINCFGHSEGFITIDNNSNGIPPFNVSVNNAAHDDPDLINNLDEGTYIVEVEDANGCRWDTTIMIMAPDMIDITLGPDQVISEGDSIQLEADVNMFYDSIAWMSNNEVLCIGCEDPMVSPDSSSTFYAFVFSEDGCMDSDVVNIIVKRKRPIYIPNAFSPNGDNVNDIFMIFGGDEISLINEFQVFNRWGEILYTANNFMPNDPAFGWDGIFNGDSMNPGVFVFFAEVEFRDGITEIFKGDVTLMR